MAKRSLASAVEAFKKMKHDGDLEAEIVIPSETNAVRLALLRVHEAQDEYMAVKSIMDNRHEARVGPYRNMLIDAIDKADKIINKGAKNGEA